MDEQYLENLYFDLANKFDEWYQTCSQGIGGGYNEPVSISDILRKYGKFRSDGNYDFIYGDITIFIDVEGQHDGSSPHYAAFVYHTNDPRKLWIHIEFTKKGWVYSHDISTHYEYNRHGMFYSQDRDNKMNNWKERVKKAKEMELRTRSGLKYGLGGGGRKSRKSRKNKKQKNRKTNRH